MATVKNIDVALRANVQKFEEGMRRGIRAVGDFVQQIPGLGSLTGVFTSLGAAAAGAGAAIAAIGASIRSAMAETDRVGDISSELGISPNRLLEIEGAARQLGVEIGTLQMGLQRLTIESAKAADGNKATQAIFSKLKIDFRQVAAAAPDEKLRMVADAMAAIENPSERARLAVELFGRGGISLLQVLEGGSEALDKAAARTRDFGNQVSERGVRATNAWEKAMGDLGVIVDGTGQKLLRLFGPAIEGVASGISKATELVAKFNELLFGGESNAEIIERISRSFAKVSKAAATIDPEVLRGIDLTNAMNAEKTKQFESKFADTMKSARSEAAKLAESLAPAKTPLDTFLEKTQRIHELHAMDLLTLEQRNELLRRASTEASSPDKKTMEMRNELLREGERVRSGLETPFEKFQRSVSSLMRLKNLGGIDANTFGRGLMDAQKSFLEETKANIREPVTGPAANVRGTQEAFRAFQEARSAHDTAKEQLALSRKMESHLSAMLRGAVVLSRAAL